MFSLLRAQRKRQPVGNQNQPPPTFYTCSATKLGAYGQVWYELEVPVDGAAPFRRLSWQIRPPGDGISVSAHWDGASADGRLDDNASVDVYFYTTLKIRDKVRIEIRRSPGTRYVGEFAYAGPFVRPYQSPDSARYYVEAEGRWGDINTWMNGRDALTFAL